MAKKRDLRYWRNLGRVNRLIEQYKPRERAKDMLTIRLGVTIILSPNTTNAEEATELLSEMMDGHSDTLNLTFKDGTVVSFNIDNGEVEPALNLNETC